VEIGKPLRRERETVVPTVRPVRKPEKAPAVPEKPKKREPVPA